MVKRTAKQVLIIAIAIAIAALLLGAIYFLFFISDPTCNDGKRNQGEEDVDCGGPCAPCQQRIFLEDLKVISTDWVHDVGNKYDVVVKVSNPNDYYGLENFNFKVSLVDDSANSIAESDWQESFILPGQTKSLIVMGIESSQMPSRASIELNKSSINWQKISIQQEPDFVIINKNYETKFGGEANFAEVKGTLINKSSADFEEIIVKVILRDIGGKLLAVNSQVMNTVRDQEYRDFLVIFPRSFSGDVTDVGVEPETNIFDRDNYFRR